MLTKNQKLGLTVQGAVWGSFFFLVMIPYTKDWQTLVTGVMSLLAAAWAAYLLNKQIRQTEAHELKRDKRKFIVARATLPLALSQICDFCERNCDQLKAAYLHSGPRNTMPAIEIITLPENVLSTVQMMIETTPHENVADRLSEILGMIQLVQARIRGCANEAPQNRAMNHRENLGSYIIDCAAVYAVTSSLFAYSRGKADFAKNYELEAMFWDKISSAFLSFGLHSQAFDDLKDTVRRNLDQEINLSSL